MFKTINLQLFATGQTKLEHVVDPQVIADMMQAELDKQIKLAPLATVDKSLQGTPGSELTVPQWDYIGDAEDITEGEAIPLTQMGKKDVKMKVKKAGKGVEITDEAMLSGFGDPIGEATRQMSLAIASKVDNDLVTALGTATQTAAGTGGLTVDNLQKALDIFDDEDDATIVVVCNPANAVELRKDAAKNWLSGTELGANRIASGVFGEILGAQVLRSRRVEKNTVYIVKQGALRLLLKKETEVEKDRDIVKKTTVITADKHYGVYLYNKKKAVKLTLS